MKNKIPLLSALLLLFLSACGVMQSAIKSTFPYTAALTVPRSSASGTLLSVTGSANSFDQRLKKGGADADEVGSVRVVSAKIVSKDPGDFNIGNFSSVKVYLSKPDSTGEVMVASRTDITRLVGNSLVLDINADAQLGKLINEPAIRVRLAYQLHNRISTNVALKLVLGLRASPR
jgi:hypothetical protein